MDDAKAKAQAQEQMDGSPAFVEGDGFSIKFQLGPVKEFGKNGCQIPEIIRILIKRLEGFNREDGPFRCRENSLAITKLEEATHWLGHRTAEREARGVEGMNQA